MFKKALLLSILLPAEQDLGGVHQELGYAYMVGGKLNW